MTNLRRRLRKVQNQLVPVQGTRYLVHVLPAGVKGLSDEDIKELDERGILPQGPGFVLVDLYTERYPRLNAGRSGEPSRGKGPDGSRKSA